MRCPHCAAEAPDGSRFCGICGRRIEGIAAQPAHAPAGQGVAPGAAAAHAAPHASPSLFELPVSPGARWARILVVLALDTVLAGAGIIMIISYVQARGQTRATPGATPPATVDAGLAEIQALTPERLRVGAAGRAGEALAPEAAEDELPLALAASGPAPGHSTSDLEGVAATVERGMPQLQRCYQQAARAAGPDRPLEGRVNIYLSIAPSGRASRVQPITNTTRSEPLARCVAGLFESWTFPPPGSQPLELVWPLRFKAPP